MTDEQNKPVRSRDEQVEDLASQIFFGARNHVDGVFEAKRHIQEAEARGAAEQRQKDAEGQEPVAWGDFAFMKKGQPFTAYLKPPHADPKFNLPLYTRPASVAALEAEIASLKEAEQLARADAEASKARAGKDQEVIRWLAGKLKETDPMAKDDYELIARDALAKARGGA